MGPLFLNFVGMHQSIVKSMIRVIGFVMFKKIIIKATTTIKVIIAPDYSIFIDLKIIIAELELIKKLGYSMVIIIIVIIAMGHYSENIVDYFKILKAEVQLPINNVAITQVKKS